VINKYFYTLLHKYLSFYIFPEDKMVELDPKTPNLFELFTNKTKHILHIDEKAGEQNPQLSAATEALAEIDPDYVVLNGNLHYIRDIQAYLERLHCICKKETKLIITYYSALWRPLLRLANVLRIRRKMPEQNWISNEDMSNLLCLAGFEIVKVDNKVLIPAYLPVVSNFINHFLAPLPFFRLFNMVNILVARPILREGIASQLPSVSVIIPARNESGNIENAILRLPKMGPADEIIFVEGNSTDNTWQEILKVQRKYHPRHNIKVAQQEGKGKGDAVRKGFAIATNEIVMILDADLTVSPEDLPKFYKAIIDNKGEFINGCRLVYPMEKEAMRFINMIGNKFFAIAFSFVLGQKLKDTLCGTKVLSRRNYLKIKEHRAYFGNFDPFGDFDLIFGASRLGLKTIEVPIVYKERVYGTTNIQRWKHGLILLRMLLFAARKIKFL